MKVRNFIGALQKGSDQDTDVTIVFDNSEKEFEVLNVSSSVGKKIITIKPVEKPDDAIMGESADDLENFTPTNPGINPSELTITASPGTADILITSDAIVEQSDSSTTSSDEEGKDA